MNLDCEAVLMGGRQGGDKGSDIPRLAKIAAYTIVNLYYTYLQDKETRYIVYSVYKEIIFIYCVYQIFM